MANDKFLTGDGLKVVWEKFKTLLLQEIEKIKIDSIDQETIIKAVRNLFTTPKEVDDKIEEAIENLPKEELDPIFTSSPSYKITENMETALESGFYNGLKYKYIDWNNTTKDALIKSGQINPEQSVITAGFDKYIDLSPENTEDALTTKSYVDGSIKKAHTNKVKTLSDNLYVYSTSDGFDIVYGSGTLDLNKVIPGEDNIGMTVRVIPSSEEEIIVNMQWNNGVKTCTICDNGYGVEFCIGPDGYWVMTSGAANTVYAPTIAYTLERNDGIDTIIVNGQFQITLPTEAAYNGRIVRICYNITANQNRVQSRYWAPSNSYTTTTVSAGHFVEFIGNNGYWYVK